MIKNFAKEFNELNNLLTEKINNVLYAWQKEIELDLSLLYIIKDSSSDRMGYSYEQRY